MLTREWFEMDIPPEVLQALNKELPIIPPDPDPPCPLDMLLLGEEMEQNKVEDMTGLQYETPQFQYSSNNINYCNPGAIPSPSPMTMMQNLNICDICGLTLATKATLKRHQMVHMRPFKCDFCSKTFSRLETFQLHHQLHERTEGQGSQNQMITDQHQKDDNNLEIQTQNGIVYECRFCPKKFTCRKQRTSHTRNHTVEKPFECSKCHKLFTRPDHLVRHLLIHSGEKPFKCKICTSTFNQRAYLVKHMRRVHVTCDA